MAGAPVGNSNARKGHVFAGQLRKILAEDPKKLEKLARTLISAAEQGEPWAMKELIDRMDGKAIQIQQIENSDGSPLNAIQVMFVPPDGSTA